MTATATQTRLYLPSLRSNHENIQNVKYQKQRPLAAQRGLNVHQIG